MLHLKSWDSLNYLIKDIAGRKLTNVQRFEASLLLADIAWDQGRPQEALQRYQSIKLSSQVQSIKQLAVVCNRIGNAYNALRMPYAAIPPLDSALELRLNQYGVNHLDVSHTYNNLGIAYLQLGDFGHSEEYHREALAIRRELASGSALVAQSLNNLALCLTDAGALEDAILHFAEAAHLYEELEEEGSQADVFVNMGNAQFALARAEEDPGVKDQVLDSAKANFQNAYWIYQQFPGNANSTTICLNNLANVARERDRLDQARAYLHEAIIEIPSRALSDPQLAETYFNLAMSHLVEGSDQLATTFLDSSLQYTGYDMDTGEMTPLTDRQTLLFALFQYAMIKASSDELSQRDTALVYFTRIDQLIAQMYVGYRSKVGKLDLAEIGHAIYEEAIQTATLLYRETNQLRYLHRAFFFAERSKAQSLLDILLREEVAAFPSLPQRDQDTLQALEQELGWLESQRALAMQQGQPQVHLDSLDRAYFRLQRVLSGRLALLAEQHPNLYQMNFRLDPPSVANLQNALSKFNACMISYFVGQEAIWIFLISEGEFTLKVVPLNARFYEAMQILHVALDGFTVSGSSEAERYLIDYVESAQYLYQLLIKPVESALSDRVIIIPDRSLGVLGFESLLTDSVSGTDSGSMPYFIRSHILSYSLSARIWEVLQSQSNSLGRGYVGFAPSFSEDLQPLSHNQAEVASVHKTMHGKAYFNGEATKTKFLEEVGDAQFVHLATHGKAETDYEELSYLAFSDAGSSARLYASEIYRLQTQADVVVLSACESGIGRWYDGAGVASLARAFTFAGAKSLLATRWQVDDRAAQEIVLRYFQNLRSGMFKDESLQQAMLSYIDQSSSYFAHPYFWSAFMVMGNSAPIQLKSGISWGKLTSAAIAISLLLFVLHHHSKSNLKHRK